MRHVLERDFAWLKLLICYVLQQESCLYYSMKKNKKEKNLLCNSGSIYRGICFHDQWSTLEKTGMCTRSRGPAYCHWELNFVRFLDVFVLCTGAAFDLLITGMDQYLTWSQVGNRFYFAVSSEEKIFQCIMGRDVFVK